MNINYLPTTTRVAGGGDGERAGCASGIVICNLPEQKCVPVATGHGCFLNRYEVSLRYTPRNKLACERLIVAMKNFREVRAHVKNKNPSVLDVLLDAIIFLMLSYRHREVNARVSYFRPFLHC